MTPEQKAELSARYEAAMKKRRRFRRLLADIFPVGHRIRFRRHGETWKGTVISHRADDTLSVRSDGGGSFQISFEDVETD